MNFNNLSTHGESFESLWSFTCINPGPVEAGESIVPARLSSAAARTFEALHLILEDLEFAEECIKAADNLGIPDGGKLNSKALIFSE